MYLPASPGPMAEQEKNLRKLIWRQKPIKKNNEHKNDEVPLCLFWVKIYELISTLPDYVYVYVIFYLFIIYSEQIYTLFICPFSLSPNLFFTHFNRTPLDVPPAQTVCKTNH